MLCCIADVACLIFGIIALATGRFTLSRSRVVQGAPARVVGILLILGPLFSAGIPVGYGAVLGFQLAANNPKAGQGQVDTTAVAREAEKHEGLILALQAGVLAFFLVAATVVAAMNAKPPKKKRVRKEEEDEEDEDLDDRPRRRRPLPEEPDEPE